MEILKTGTGVAVTGISDFDLPRIFECGQCFRWDPDENGVYTGVAFGRAARLEKRGDDVLITCTADDFENIWRGYFDLDLDYAGIRRSLCINDYMCAAAEFGAGIRILRQDPWEALCSFIISQCNNIPRIKKIIETLCGLYGSRFSALGGEFHAFPEAETLASLSPDDLAPLRCGYRAPYIIDAARAVSEGRIDLCSLSKGDPKTALKSLKTLNGVGDKVANCAVLFGLHMLDAFPVDVWMKRAISNHCGPDFDPSVFSPYAGIAQQYMFYYERSGASD